MTHSRSLQEVLTSVTDVLFPHYPNGTSIDVNSRSPDGDTPLHVLAWRKDLTGMEVLIAAGADVNAVGDMGETPLHVAVRMADRDMVVALVRAGARSDIRSEFGATASDLALAIGPEAVDWLRR